MNTLLKLTTCALAATCVTGMALAQQMTFSGASLASGSALEAGATYRFSNVTSGLDAIVTIDALTNATLLNLDSPSADSIEMAKWRPSFVGTGGEGSHYADFTVVFYANGTDTPSAPDRFTASVFGNDLSDLSNGPVLEFAHVTGFTSTLPSGGTDSPLAAWSFENKPGYAIRLGWQGGDDAGSGRSFGIDMTNTSVSNQFSLDSATSSLASAVPEPSSSLLIVLSVFPLALRRKRKGIACK